MNSWQSYLWKLLLRVSFKNKDFASMSVAEARGYFERMMDRVHKPDPTVTVLTIDAGGVPAEEIVPRGGASGRTILYLHGGGYYMGSPRTHRALTERLAMGLSARVIAPDYRLAPEHRFPAPVEDALKVYRWLLKTGVPAAAIAVMGDSAGGGLTFALLLGTKREGLDQPGCAVGFSPWTDLTGSGESLKRNAWADPLLDPRGMDALVRNYMGEEGDPRDPLASPLFGDLAGLPPSLIQVGDIEVLLDDSVRLAERARAAGVEVELEIWPGMPHVWQLMASHLPEARRALDRVYAFVRAHTTAARQASAA